jgi:uncharacterized membrane protein
MTPVPRQRLESVDLLRGVIMIVMALDHVRDYFGTAQNPLDLDTTTPQLFFTRWVTYFCAPVFFLLTGTGASLSLRRRTPAELSTFLVTRGLWLIFVELVPMRCLALQFNFDYRVTMLIVLWALGWAMIVLALLVRLPPWVAATFGLVLVAGHNLLDNIDSSSALWTILHSPGFLVSTPRHVVRLTYPLIPWIGVTAIGYSLGRVYGWTPERRRALLLRLGVAATLLFVALRATNVYGDPIPWSTQRTPLLTLLSFLGVDKYPPSLLFLSMTLGPALIFLWAVDRGTPRLLRPALVFGKVPFFYYVVHFFLIHLLAVVVCLALHGSAHWMFESPDLGSFPFARPPGWGFSLPVVYLVWGLVVLAMYPLCRWFAALKQRRSDAWLSYL